MICADTLIFSHFTGSPSLGIAVLWLLTEVPPSVSFSLSDLTSNVSFLAAGELEVPSNVFKTSERACLDAEFAELSFSDDRFREDSDC